MLGEEYTMFSAVYHCLSRLVRTTGLEPVRITATVFETVATTYFAISACRANVVGRLRN